MQECVRLDGMIVHGSLVSVVVYIRSGLNVELLLSITEIRVKSLL